MSANKNSVATVLNYICANPECNKQYVKREFHCYDVDCCSMKCLTSVIKPRREKEAMEAAEKRAREKTINHFDCGGGRCF